MIVGISGKIGSGKDEVGKIIQYLTCTETQKHNINHYDWAPGVLESASNWKIKKFAGKLKDIVCLLIGCTREQLEDQEFKNKELGEEWWRYKIHDGSVFRWATLEEYNKEGKYQKFIVKLTPRKLLQLLGTDCGRDIIHPNIWVNALFADYTPIMPQIRRGRMTSLAASNAVKEATFNPKYPNWIITDVRFPNEAQAIKDRGGIVIRVNRGGFNITDGKEIVSNVIETDDLRGYDEFVYQDEASVIYRTSEWKRKTEHPSETALDNAEFDYIIDNNGTIEELIEKVREILVKEGLI